MVNLSAENWTFCLIISFALYIGVSLSQEVIILLCPPHNLLSSRGWSNIGLDVVGYSFSQILQKLLIL